VARSFGLHAIWIAGRVWEQHRGSTGLVIEQAGMRRDFVVSQDGGKGLVVCAEVNGSVWTWAERASADGQREHAVVALVGERSCRWPFVRDLRKALCATRGSGAHCSGTPPV
jgi:hypothetical protein